ncbi:MAG: glycoside hydrolase [Ginsengibacter sp.]
MNKKSLILLSIIITLHCKSVAQEKRFYIANDDHTDYMWTANEVAYKNAMLTTLDRYLVQIDSTIAAGLPFIHQAKYNCDGSFWFWLYEKNRNVAQMINLVNRVKSGHITVPYNPLAVLYGGMPAEASLRGMYYAGHLQKKYGIDMKLAVTMEGQVLPLGLSSLWAGSGVKYSWRGVCACVSVMNKEDLQHRDNEVYYYKGLDSQKVLMKWYSLAQVIPPCGIDGNQSLGGYAEARCLSDDLINRMRQKSLVSRKKIIGAFGYGWDDLQSYTNGFISLATTSSNTGEKIIVSNEIDYFKDIEAVYGKTLPVETVARGNEWDIYVASLAEVSARIKRSVEKLRAAEALATIVSLSQPGFAKSLTEMRDSAWMSIGLYPEHDWTADGPVPRIERATFQRKLEHNFSRYTDTLYTLALQLLGKQIKGPHNKQRFFVFNSLNWKRNDFADLPYQGNNDITVIDVFEKRAVLWQLIIKNGQRYLRILATNIPGIGYKVFEIIEKPTAIKRSAATLTGHSFENNRYKINLTTQGVITSIVDKLNDGRELVKPSPEGWYCNDMGSNTAINGDSLFVDNEGPVSVTVRARSYDTVKHTSSITLFNSLIPRIDIQNNIEQNFSSVLTTAFSFNISNPDIWHEEIGAVIKAKLANNGGHYAAKNARYDWLTLNHFASVVTEKFNLTLANRDCYFFKPGKSTHDALDENASYISVLTGGQVDGNNLGIRGQGGDSSFEQQFSLSVHDGTFNKAASMKSSLEFQQPLIAAMVEGERAADLPADHYSFIKTKDPGFILWALKPAEEGIKQGGIIARIWNLNESSAISGLKFNTAVSSAKETTHVEVDLKSIPVDRNVLQVMVEAQQMKTFRIKFGNSLSVK